MRYPDPRTILIIGFSLLLLTVTASAHPPSALVLSYDPVTGQLQVTFTHTVPDPSTHYVERVQVEIEGGPDLLETSYSSQPTASTFTYTFPLQIPAGTTIRVRGECSIGGEIRKDLVISGNPATTGTTSTLPTETTSPTIAVTSPPTVTTITAVMTVQTTEGMVSPTATQLPSTTKTGGFTVLAGFLALSAVGVAVLWRR